MKRDLLEILKCPICDHSDFELIDPGEDGNEIREAVLACRACGARHEVEKGIATVMPELSPVVASEIEAWSKKIDTDEYDQEKHDKCRETMLKLPYLSEDLDKDVNSRIQWMTFGKNFERFVLTDDLQNRAVLDVGAGRCWTSALMAGRGASVVALDIITKIYIGLETADIYLEEKAVFFERVGGDMHKLPFRDGVFDLVVVNVSAHHAEEPEVFFREVHRVLRSGGRFTMVSEPIAWRGDEPPPEVEEGINENQIRLNEWFSLFRRSGFVPQRCEVKYGKGISCVLTRKGDKRPLTQRLTAFRHRLAAVVNFLFWKVVFWERKRMPGWEDAVKDGFSSVKTTIMGLPRSTKSAARKLIIALDLPTSPRVWRPGAGYLRARFLNKGPPPDTVFCGLPEAEPWLGRGWYSRDPRVQLPVRRVFKRASVTMSLPAEPGEIELKLGALPLYGFELPVKIDVKVGHKTLSSIGVHEMGLRSYVIEVPGESRSRGTTRVTLRVKRVNSRGLRSRLTESRTLGVVVESISAGPASKSGL